MNKEQLQALLNEGKITQEEYDQKVAELEQQKGDPAGSKDNDDKNKDFDVDSFLNSDDFKKLIQSEVDKVRTKYTQEKKDLEKKLDEYRQSTMSKEEILAEKERALAEYEAKVKRSELDFETRNLLEEKKLPSTLLKYLPGSSLEERTTSLNELVEVIDSFVEAKAAEKFKSQGRDMDKGSGGNPSKKSFAEMTIEERLALDPDEYFNLKN